MAMSEEKVQQALTQVCECGAQIGQDCWDSVARKSEPRRTLFEAVGRRVHITRTRI